MNFDDLWPNDISSAGSEESGISQERDVLKDFWICGKEVPRGYWVSPCFFSRIVLISLYKTDILLLYYCDEDQRSFQCEID